MSLRNSVLIVLLMSTLTAWSAASPGVSVATGLFHQASDTDFPSFLDKFAASASFQYSRIKFPLTSPIILLNEDEEEETFPFTKEKWLLLDRETFNERRIKTEEDGVYITKFVINDPTRKEFEAGYEESELDLWVVFELIDEKWHVTDCYNSCYAFDLPAAQLSEAISRIQEDNKLFEAKYP